MGAFEPAAVHARVRLLLDHLAEQFRGEPWKPGKAGSPR